jgi:hypothetical protein
MWRCVVEQASRNILRNDGASETLHSTCTAAHYHLHRALHEPDCSTMKTKALWPLKTSGTICPMTQWHIPECLNLQQYHWTSNLTTSKYYILESCVIVRVLSDVFKDGGQAVHEEKLQCSCPTTECHVPPKVRRHHCENHKRCDVQVPVYFSTFAEVQFTLNAWHQTTSWNNVPRESRTSSHPV